MFDPRMPVSRDGPIATVTFNRPEVHNCMDLAMWRSLQQTMEALSGDDDLRCIVLRGGGTKTFCAGADIAAFAEERGSRKKEDIYGDVLHHSLQSIRLCRHPVVAMLIGNCIGGGAGIASMCDFRIGGPSLRFGITARNLGIWYPYAEIDPIIELAGTGVAAEILIEGRILNGREAYEKGLLSRLVDDEAVEAETNALARRVSTGSPLSARFHKAAIRKLRGPLPVSPEQERAVNAFADTEDFKGAAEAFLGKRKFTFRGR
jgi:enoyl-CoA hydratase